MNKLNNSGQTLIMFVILVPVIILLMALVIDISYLYRENAKLESTTKNIIKNLYDNKDSINVNEMVIQLYQKNEIDIKKLKVNIENENFKISNEYKIDSIFGKIIGLKKYEVKISMRGYLKDSKLKVIKE